MRGLGLVSFGTIVFLTQILYQQKQQEKRIADVCGLVETHFYKDSQQLKNWKKRCADLQGMWMPFLTKKRVAKLVNETFAEFEVSHISLYVPSEYKFQWTGKRRATGINAHWVDGSLVVKDVYQDSPAHHAGLKKGDIIEAIKGHHLDESFLVRNSVSLSILRDSKKIRIAIEADSFQRNQNLSWKRKDSQLVLSVPSFRKEFFTKNKLAPLTKELKRNLKRVVVDLRGNSGGDVVAGLRFLSLFFCQSQLIGRLQQPRFSTENEVNFSNDLATQQQIEKLSEYKSIRLETFANDTCFAGNVDVLIDHETASVSEIVAAAFKSRPCSKIYGTISAGHVVLAAWFELPRWGKDFTISIPIAKYTMNDQRELEGHGLHADKTLYYDLETEAKGKDSWLEFLWTVPGTESGSRCVMGSSHSQ